MKYISTRGNSPAQTFSEILLGGLAPDGGLYMPESYPHFSDTDLAAMRAMNYRELAFTVLSRFADDIPAADLRAIVDKTYTAEVYCHVREGQNAEDITPTLKLEEGEPHQHCRREWRVQRVEGATLGSGGRKGDASERAASATCGVGTERQRQQGGSKGG